MYAKQRFARAERPQAMPVGRARIFFFSEGAFNFRARKDKSPLARALIFGAPGEIRTPDHLVRSQVLYPAELRAQKHDMKSGDYTRQGRRKKSVLMTLGGFKSRSFSLTKGPVALFPKAGGERGIRTLDGILSHTPLAGARLRPLGHLSLQAQSARKDTCALK